jgi:hypothetical protein
MHKLLAELPEPADAASPLQLVWSVGDQPAFGLAA